jgi:hypothetical protein
MGKYNTYTPDRPKSARAEGIHPIWRGIGFLFMVLVPLLSYGIAVILLQEPLTRPYLLRATDLFAKPGQLLYFGDPYIYIKLLITVSITLVLYALFAFITFAINSMVGVSRYGPYDVPPVTKPRGVRIRKAR